MESLKGATCKAPEWKMDISSRISSRPWEINWSRAPARRWSFRRTLFFVTATSLALWVGLFELARLIFS
jgi:hypothetical protein